MEAPLQFHTCVHLGVINSYQVRNYKCFVTFLTEVLYFLGSQVLKNKTLLLCGLISLVFY